MVQIKRFKGTEEEGGRKGESRRRRNSAAQAENFVVVLLKLLFPLQYFPVHIGFPRNHMWAGSKNFFCCTRESSKERAPFLSTPCLKGEKRVLGLPKLYIRTSENGSRHEIRNFFSFSFPAPSNNSEPHVLSAEYLVQSFVRR